MKKMNMLLADMHQIVNPGEYGLGDNMEDKEAWEKLGDVLDQTLEEFEGNPDAAYVKLSRDEAEFLIEYVWGVIESGEYLKQESSEHMTDTIEREITQLIGLRRKFQDAVNEIDQIREIRSN